MAKKGNGAAVDKTRAPAVGRSRAKRMSPQARRAQLVDCGVHIFAQKGLGAVSHTDLAEKAKVALSTTFHYFPTKEEMVSAVLDEVARYLIDDMVVSHFDNNLNAVESIEDLLMTFCDAIDARPEYIHVWLQWSVSIRGEVWTAYLDFYKKAINGVKKILKRGFTDGSVSESLDVDDAARIIVGVAHMVAQMKFAKNSREHIQHTIHSLVTGYLSK